MRITKNLKTNKYGSIGRLVELIERILSAMVKQQNLLCFKKCFVFIFNEKLLQNVRENFKL